MKTASARRSPSSLRGLAAIVTALVLVPGVFVPVASASSADADKKPAAEVFEPAETSAGNYLAALVAGAQRDTSAAASYIRQALKQDPRNRELTERSFEAQLADGNMDEAMRLARRTFERDSNSPLARLVLGTHAIKDKQFQTARARLTTGARGRGADITNTLLTSWSWLGSNQADKAVETLDRLKGESAFAVFKDYHAGLILDLAGKTDEAGKRLKSAYEASGGGPVRLAEAYARFLARNGKVDEAKDLLLTYLVKVGRHPNIVALLADLQAGKPVERSIRSVQEGAAEVLFGLGTEGSRQGDETAAMIYLRLARYLDPKHNLATVALADIYERLKLYDKAVELYDGIEPNSPLLPAAEVQIGLNLETMGRSDEAINRLRATVEKRPSDLEAVSALGNVLRAQKKYDEAVQVFSKGIDTLGTPERSNWSLYYFRGTAYERAKDWPKAEADFKKALELLPDQPQVLNYLGYSWVDRNMNLDEAFKMLKRAVELSPRDGYIIDSLGWAYYRLGQYDNAVRELERAVLLKPGDPTINDHLGDAYWKTGRKLEAKFQWSHAKDRNPEPEELEKIVAKLQNGIEEPTPPAAAEVEKAAKPNGG